MEDNLQPDRAILEKYYERGYRLWHGLYLAALADPLDARALDFQNAFPRHPYFVPELHLDKSSGVELHAWGTSTWKPSSGDCPLPSFEKRYQFPVTQQDPLVVSLKTNDHRLRKAGDQISLLMLGWAYVLSQRWSELIPGARAMEYTNNSATLSEGGAAFEKTDGLVIDLGVITDEAVRWWAAVLAPGEGWAARIHHNGQDLRSPWSVSLQTAKNLILTFRTTQSRGGRTSPPSYSTAAQYIADYAKYHGIEDQSRAAFAAALLLPARRIVSRKLCWSCPAWHNKPPEPSAEQYWPPWGKERDQLDRLITMSCNINGIISLLCSSFVDPDLQCNVSDAWIQGAFAVMDQPEAQKPDVLRSMLSKRSPHLGFLWLGATLLDIQDLVIERARSVFYIIDLHSAAWTGTLMTFFQRPVASYPPNVERIQRVDEARLMFLSQTEFHCEPPPLVPFPPFGTIAVKDCVLEVQSHASCSGSHELLYAGWKWDGHGDVQDAQDTEIMLLESSEATGHAVASMAVHYDKLDCDRCRLSVSTKDIFKWLRELDGWPVAERDIHDWVDKEWMGVMDWSLDYESASPEGDGKSTTSRRNVSPWLSRTITKRSRTI
ncbi:hypothetical protein E4U57_001592 [Claviceps arundinis]|uniref:Uncharacterized protein n=1 Tax=Claviceps arundinis TaxID=1623583 RepID=A0A9P7MP87_9HYPO|nr:hypothetical protein E4U56_002381 [Claviceps arundinis]KAG5966889.1 hypothetical protein E4U57_001592 [Claviceps arundinis]